MGSISGTPSYPSISGYTQSTIDSDVTNTESTYNTRKSEYSTAKTNYDNSVSATSTALNNYNATGYTLTTAYNNFVTAQNNYISVFNNPNSTTAQKEAAVSQLQTATNIYNNVNTKYKAVTTALTDLQNKKNALSTALDNLQSDATSYATALARKQMFVDQQASNNINAQITSLYDDISDPQFQGLTLVAYNQLVANLNALNTNPRQNLINAYNAYRYLEWQIAAARANSIKAASDEQYYYYSYLQNTNDQNRYNLYVQAKTARENAQSSVTTLINQRSSIDSALNIALNAYKSAYNSVQDPLISAINSAKAQVSNWANYVTSLQQAAENKITQMYTSEQSHDTSTRESHNTTYTDTNNDVVSDALSNAQNIYAANIARILSGSADISTDVSTPTLPATTRSMSISQLMWIISQVQLMIEELSRQMSDSDHKINAFRRSLGASDVENYVQNRLAADTWAVTIFDADTAYNSSVLQDNLSAYNKARTIYLAYQERVSLINQVIDDINAEIDKQNERAKALVDAANSINQEITNAINATSKNKAETTNILDYTGADVDTPVPDDITKPDDISYPADIPHYSHISNLPAPPPAIEIPSPGENPEFPSDGQIASMNQAIKDLASKIAPFKERVQKAIALDVSSSESGYDKLELEQFYKRTTIPIRDLRLKTEFDGYFTFLISFSSQLSAMRTASALSVEEQNRFMALAVQRIEDILGSPLTTSNDNVKDTSQSVGAGLGLSTADPKIQSSKVASFINQVVQSANFSNAVSRIFEISAIIAGLQVAGITPEAMKNLSTMGIPLSEILQENGIDLSATIQSQSKSALAVALIEQLSLSAKNVSSLQNTAIDILFQSSEVKGMSAEEIQQAIASLIALLQMLLLLIASLLGTSEGLSPTNLLSSFGQTSTAESDLKTILQNIGIPETKAQLLVNSLGENILPLLALFKDMNISVESQLGLLMLIGANRGGITLDEGIAGGTAFLQTILETLKKEGVIVPQGAISNQSDVGAAILSKEFLNELVVQLEVKTDTIQRDVLKQEILREEIKRNEIRRKEQEEMAQINQEEDLRSRVQNILNSMSTSLEESARNPLTGLLPLSVSDQLGITKDDSKPFAAPSVLDRLREDFRQLPVDTQKRAIDTAKNRLKEIPHLTDEDKAVLAAAIAQGKTTSQEISALLALLIDERETQAGIRYNSLGVELAQQIFHLSEEELQIREELMKTRPREEDLQQMLQRPSTLPKQTQEIMREAFEVISRSFVDQKFASKSIESFTHVISKMSDFNEVAVNFLMDPAKVFLKEFSIITRSSFDKSNQPAVFLEG